MQTTLRKTETKVKTKEKTSKDDLTSLSKKVPDEKLKKGVYSVSTPRNYVQKSTTADIYAQKKSSQVTKAPKKVVSVTNKSSNVSPMKDQLKSTSSASISLPKKVKSSTNIKTDANIPASARITTPRTGKDLPFLNVTVNSPIAKKKLDYKDGGRSLNSEVTKIKDGSRSSNPEVKKSKDGGRNLNSEVTKSKDGGKKTDDTRRTVNPKSSQNKEVKRKSSDNDTKEVGDRQRTKTRTLNDNEVKVLTADVVDNNAEMMNLSRKLAAKPKAFYIDLDESKSKLKNHKTEKSSEDEIDYEDDFDSYESDFESDHESPSSNSHATTDHDTGDESPGGDGENDGDGHESAVVVEDTAKEGRDEEKMLDSGNFDLRDARSANKVKTVMADILEDTETDVRSSLTDEGFQDMSAGCSMKTVHTDVLERPLFIDFTKAKENKRKRKIFEKLKQRAKDILSMVTLHEMSYSLFEMKPIPYDLYMATFGRSNYIQTASQTFEDGVTEEVQTEEIVCEERWTQHPVEFSKHDIYLKTDTRVRKYSHSTEDYVSKFMFLINKNSDEEISNRINIDEDYKSNPLRVYFEQKNGAGPAQMLPYEVYKNKLKNTDFSTTKLKRFLKKVECRISNILSGNGGSDRVDLIKSSKYPFSKGYLTVSVKSITNEKLTFLKQFKMTGIIFSDSKSNLILTVHKKSTENSERKCVICMWDLSIVRSDPLKILKAVDLVNIGRFIGNSDGIFVAALHDGSVHLWDLSEEPTWHPGVASTEKPIDLVEVETKAMTQTELDREWNLKNRNVGCDSVTPQCLLQACSYTTSAVHMQNDEAADTIAGLEVDTRTSASQDGGRKMLGQVCSLQRNGILRIWSIIQEKKATDMGKAYWSKMKLEINQTISLIEYLDLPRSISPENILPSSFNLNAAKRRTSVRRKEKSLRKQLSRQKSAVKVDSDRPVSAASVMNRNLPLNNWESGIVCNDLKIMRVDSKDHYLVGKNCGEVLCCTRTLGVFKINRFCVATEPSSVTSLEASPHSLPYFLAATDSGTVNLCSVLEARVLLTLDCRNGPPTTETEKYQVDQKGRYLGSTAVTRPPDFPTLRPDTGISVKSVIWSRVNPCCMFVMVRSGAFYVWDLTHSDIRAKYAGDSVDDATASQNALALLTAEGDVHVHRLSNEQQTMQYLGLLQKYIALL